MRTKPSSFAESSHATALRIGLFVAFLLLLAGGLASCVMQSAVSAIGSPETRIDRAALERPARRLSETLHDHASYWRFKMPAIVVTDTAFLRNPNYHEAGDTADTLDFARMAKVVRGVHAVAMEF